MSDDSTSTEGFLSTRQGGQQSEVGLIGEKTHGNLYSGPYALLKLLEELSDVDLGNLELAQGEEVVEGEGGNVERVGRDGGGWFEVESGELGCEGLTLGRCCLLPGGGGHGWVGGGGGGVRRRKESAEGRWGRGRGRRAVDCRYRQMQRWSERGDGGSLEWLEWAAGHRTVVCIVIAVEGKSGRGAKGGGGGKELGQAGVVEYSQERLILPLAGRSSGTSDSGGGRPCFESRETGWCLCRSSRPARVPVLGSCIIHAPRSTPLCVSLPSPCCCGGKLVLLHRTASPASTSLTPPSRATYSSAMLPHSRTLHRTSTFAASAAHRCFSASPSPSSSRSPPPSSTAPRPSRQSDTGLYRHIFRVAARGADEVAAKETGSAPATASRYAEARFRPTPQRRVPPVGTSGGLGGSVKKSRTRGTLVKVDRERLAASGKKQFSTTAALGRLAEESLQEVEGYDLVDGVGEHEDGTGSGRIKGAVQTGDFVHTTRCVALLPSPSFFSYAVLISTSHSNGIPLSGVFLAPNMTVRGFILTAGGLCTDVNLDDITFVIPAFIDASRAALLPVPSTSPSSAVATPIEHDNPVVGEVLQSLRQLEMALEAETQQLMSSGANDLYRILLDTPSPKGSADAKKRPAPPQTYTTARTALQALQLPVTPLHPTAAREERLLAVHRILLAKPEHFVADPQALKLTGRFDFRPRDEVERFDKVKEWVRNGAKEVSEWAEKTARVREWARAEERKDGAGQEKRELALRSLPAGNSTFDWTPSDRTILLFLRDTLAFDRLIQEQPHMTLAPALIKLVDSAAARLGFEGWGAERTVRKGRLRAFLAEIGVVRPWEDWAAQEKSTGLAEWDKRGEMVEKAVAKAQGRVKMPAKGKGKGRSSASTQPSSSELYPVDPHDSVRHDFGSARVYTIDDPGASELDDGISISPGPPSPSSGCPTHWVHVHVADPTALLHPNHLLAKLARVRDHTEYFPEKTFSMFPESFTVGQKLSLGALEGGEQRVLSLGFRVDETGEVLEREVKAGIVRNVKRLTYGAVDKVFGYEAPGKGPSLVFGPARTEEREQERTGRKTDDATLADDTAAVSELRTLHRLASHLLQRRVDSSAIAWQFPHASVSVSTTSSLSLSPQYTLPPSPSFFSGAPRVEFRLPSQSAAAIKAAFTDSPASLIVSELMVAANRSAARFAVERGIAVPFRQQSAPLSPQADIDAVLSLRNPTNGFIDAKEILRRGLDFAPGLTKTSPGPHWPMGIKDEYGYVQTTSPLRRYSDLFAHYQIKSALLPPDSASKTFAPALVGQAVQSHLDGFNAARKARNRLGQAAETFWALWVVKHKLSLLPSPSSSPAGYFSFDPSSLSDEDHLALQLLTSQLTAVALRPPSHSTIDNVWVQRVLIPQLGIRGTLQVERAEMAPEVGGEVGVKIEEVVLAARSSVVVALRR